MHTHQHKIFPLPFLMPGMAHPPSLRPSHLAPGPWKGTRGTSAEDQEWECFVSGSRKQCTVGSGTKPPPSRLLGPQPFLYFYFEIIRVTRSCKGKYNDPLLSQCCFPWFQLPGQRWSKKILRGKFQKQTIHTFKLCAVLRSVMKPRNVPLGSESPLCPTSSCP